jgi:hypothetical protein
MVDADQLTPEQAFCVNEVVQTQTKEGKTVRVKLVDKLAALDSLARYHNQFRRTRSTKGLWVSFEDGTVHGVGPTKREVPAHTSKLVEVVFEDADVPIQNGMATPETIRTGPTELPEPNSPKQSPTCTQTPKLYL